MPNLKYFETLINSLYVQKELYLSFIKKILFLKLIKKIMLIIQKDSYQKSYSKKELEKIFPNINYDNYSQISIQKYHR